MLRAAQLVSYPPPSFCSKRAFPTTGINIIISTSKKSPATGIGIDIYMRFLFFHVLARFRSFHAMKRRTRFSFRFGGRGDKVDFEGPQSIVSDRKSIRPPDPKPSKKKRSPKSSRYYNSSIKGLHDLFLVDASPTGSFLALAPGIRIKLGIASFSVPSAAPSSQSATAVACSARSPAAASFSPSILAIGVSSKSPKAKSFQRKGTKARRGGRSRKKLKLYFGKMCVDRAECAWSSHHVSGRFGTNPGYGCQSCLWSAKHVFPGKRSSYFLVSGPGFFLGLAKKKYTHLLRRQKGAHLEI